MRKLKQENLKTCGKEQYFFNIKFYNHETKK
jgi:hypothetical protein